MSSSIRTSSADEYSEPETHQDRLRPAGLYQEAARYGKVLREATPQSTADARVVDGFADLVEHDLDAPEQTKTGRFAQFVVNDWSGKERSPDPSLATPSDELEEDDISPDSSVTSEDRAEASRKHEVGTNEPRAVPSVPNEPQSNDNDPVKLLPEAIVDLLVREFGPLTSNAEEEKLLLEADAAIFKSVAILVSRHQHKAVKVNITYPFTGCAPPHDPSLDISCVPARRKT